MAVPDFQSLMLPLLRFAGDGKEHSLSEAREFLAGELGLTQAEQDELLPSRRKLELPGGLSQSRLPPTLAE